jgi:hypothetical protein
VRTYPREEVYAPATIKNYDFRGYPTCAQVSPAPRRQRVTQQRRLGLQAESRKTELGILLLREQIPQ